MLTDGRRRRLLGRTSECSRLDRLVGNVRAGESQVLVLRGEPGVGKSALLDHLLETASGCQIVRTAGIESEMELAFAGLHQLCAPMLDRLSALPVPQRDALGTAFGLTAGPPPDPLLVGLAVLGLLSDVAEEGPLLCIVDDAQWQDRASLQTFGVVARRLLGESVGLVFAVREPSAERDLADLPELAIDGLRDADARLLLDSVVPGRLDERVRDRIVAETRGNPLALLELPKGLTPAQLAGGFGLLNAAPLANRIEGSLLRQLDSVPGETRRLLLVAAAEPLGDVTLLWRAAGHLGLGPDAAGPAQAAALIELGARVRFRHPLVRSAIYRAASFADRREVHHALAEATDADADPDRMAWHRAHAAVEPDELVAGELERSAGRAQGRGGAAAAAAFLARATELTPDPVRRAERALAAAQANLDAAAADRASEFLGMAELTPLDELQRARVDLLRAEIAFATNRGRDAPPLLLKAARRLDPLDISLARDTYLSALSAAQFTGRLSAGDDTRVIAEHASAAARPAEPPRASDLLLDGLAARLVDGYAAGAPTLKRALNAFRDVSDGEALRWLWLACNCALDLWDDDSLEVLATRHVRLARDGGALSVLPLALNSLLFSELIEGGPIAAASPVEQQKAASEATGAPRVLYGALALAAWSGDEQVTSELIDANIKEAVPRGEGIWMSLTEEMSAVLYNGLGRYEEAAGLAREAAAHPDELAVSGWALTELVEAAARIGDTEGATDALERLAERTRASGTAWALGIEARSRALVTEGDRAEPLYREAITLLAGTRVGTETARSRLVYGEWLRRQGRRLDAREELRAAHALFSEMGMEAFAERARHELAATGETVRKRTLDTRDELTAQEAQIARLARAGHTNREIGAQLFISPRTVEWHLHKVFEKLGISSRKDLRSTPADGAPMRVTGSRSPV